MIVSTCLPVQPGCSERFGPRNFVSHLCRSCLPLHPGSSARIISPTSLHLSPALGAALVFHLSPTCLPRVSQYALDALSALVRMISHFSQLSPSCLPLHSGFSARMISSLSPTCPGTPWILSAVDLSFSAHMISHLFPTCVHLPPLVAQSTLDALSGLVPVIPHLSLSPTTFWVMPT